MGTQSARATRTIPTAIAMILAAAAASAQQAPPADKAVLGEVVVTAQKRAQALSDIPMSVSVLAGEALERQQVDNFQDLVSLVPGLSINTNTRGVTRISLRGINTGGVASTVGVYVNDVPFGSSSGLANGAILSGDFDTFDMNRIEVLRGPQGTLYGASSLGGVIKYVANEPSTADFEGKVQASTEDVSGGDMGYSAAGVLNMPAGETFAVRVSGYYRNDDGFVDSIGNNPVPTLTLPGVNIEDGTRDEKNLNGLETYGGRISALFEPSDRFKLNLTALFQDIRSDNSDVFEADPVTFRPLYDGLVASRYHPEWTHIDYRIYSATIDWKLGGTTLQSVTSYGTFEDTFQRDLGGIPVAPGIRLDQFLTFLFSDPATGDPLTGVIQNQTTSTDKFSQEFRLLSPDSDSFEWLLGVYYTDEDSGIKPQTILPVFGGTEDVIPGYPVVLGDGFITSTYEETALFGNATWHLTDRFDLSFGGRWSNNDQTAQQQLDGILAGGTQNFDDVKSSESPFTWSFSPRFEFSDTTSAYLRVATGFRPGGPNVLPPNAPPGTPASYDSDKLTSYELGIKTGTADGRYSLEFAYYYLDWEDIQLFARINNVGLNANGGKAKSRGFELTTAARLSDGFTVGFNAAYTNADLAEDTDPLVGGHDGDPLPFVPDWQFGLSGDYEWAVGASTAYVGGQVAYTGERMANFSTLTPDGTHQFVPDYTTVDLRTGVDFGTWSIELYGKNLTDERGINDVLDVGPYPNGAIGLAIIRPRTIGLQLGAKF